MKNIFKKNQVIVTALVIMIAVAGYLNFTEENMGNGKIFNSENTVETVADSNSESDATDEFADISDEDIENQEEILAQLKESDAVETIGENEDGDATATSAESTAEPTDKKEAEKENTDKKEETTATSASGEAIASTEKNNAGEAVLVSNTIDNSFFASAKLTREQTRAKNKETLLELVNNTSISEKQKNEAIAQMMEMTKLAEKETATETLLEAKGFSETVVSIVDGKVDVVVNATKLSQKDIAQIEDIVKRKTEISASNIVISPVGVE